MGFLSATQEYPYNPLHYQHAFEGEPCCDDSPCQFDAGISGGGVVPSWRIRYGAQYSSSGGCEDIHWRFWYCTGDTFLPWDQALDRSFWPPRHGDYVIVRIHYSYLSCEAGFYRWRWALRTRHCYPKKSPNRWLCTR